MVDDVIETAWIDAAKKIQMTTFDGKFASEGEIYEKLTNSSFVVLRQSTISLFCQYTPTRICCECRDFRQTMWVLQRKQPKILFIIQWTRFSSGFPVENCQLPVHVDGTSARKWTLDTSALHLMRFAKVRWSCQRSVHRSMRETRNDTDARYTVDVLSPRCRWSGQRNQIIVGHGVPVHARCSTKGWNFWLLRSASDNKAVSATAYCWQQQLLIKFKISINKNSIYATREV